MKNKTSFLQSIDLCIKSSLVKRNTGYYARHKENDAEHGFQLAIVAWAVNRDQKLGLDDEKLMKYSLVHDLVEAYSGDVDAQGSKKKIAHKKESERKAMTRLKRDYNNLPWIWNAVDEYERKDSPESRLVQVLDKITPDIHIRWAKGNYYLKRNITLDKWLEWLLKKIDYPTLDPKVKKIVDNHIKEMSKEARQVFLRKKP